MCATLFLSLSLWNVEYASNKSGHNNNFTESRMYMCVSRSMRSAHVYEWVIHKKKEQFYPDILCGAVSQSHPQYFVASCLTTIKHFQNVNPYCCCCFYIVYFVWRYLYNFHLVLRSSRTFSTNNILKLGCLLLTAAMHIDSENWRNRIPYRNISIELYYSRQYIHGMRLCMNCGVYVNAILSKITGFEWMNSTWNSSC